jgi:hypothetical protein
MSVKSLKGEGEGEGPSADSKEVRSRLPREVIDRIDGWRGQQKDKPTRPEAVKRLLIAHFWPAL